MATSTGKKARKAHGTRAAAKRAKGRRGKARKRFGRLPVSVISGTAGPFVARNSQPEDWPSLAVDDQPSANTYYDTGEDDAI